MDKEQMSLDPNITNTGVKNQEIVDEMRVSYLNYAMSVIVSRALPDAKDGLKPVQRRIIYAMYKLGFLPSKAYKKSARTVGEVIGKYHPHGDTAVYDAMVRMAQNFNVRYLLVDGQGNFGSIDGDSAAAMRYTESKLQKLTMEVVDELEKGTVNFRPNYDGSTREPDTLPSKLPLLLLNGADGIAVGMATKIPPHNLTEISDAILEIIKNGNNHENEKYSIPDYNNLIKSRDDINQLDNSRFPKFRTDLSVETLLKYVKGPDFPTGAEMYDQSGIVDAYATGRGRIIMRAVANIEETTGGKYKIVISEIPYQVNKARLVSKIADLVKDKIIEGVYDIRDESSKGEIRVVVYIKRDAKPKSILNRLFKYTEMQKSYNVNMLALVDNEPHVITLARALEIFIEHRQRIIIKRTEFELGKSKEREHILEGLMIALDNLDEVIDTIRKSKDSEEAKDNLIKKFKLSEIQAQAILDMQLRRLAALERQKIEDEYKEIKKIIQDLLTVLNTPQKVLDIISEETIELKNKYGDERRTKVFKGRIGEISEDDLVPQEDVVVAISKQGYIKRVKLSAYSLQQRGGVGKKFMSTKEDDSVEHVFSTNTHDSVLFFTSKGRVFKIKVYDIPEASRVSKGKPIINLIDIDQDELITSVLNQSKSGDVVDQDVLQEGEIKSENEGKSYQFLLMATEKGTVKKTEISEFENIKSNGLIAIKLTAGDQLAWVRPTTGDSEIVLITEQGRSIRFHETDVRETGRSTIGVRGIKFKKPDDRVIAMDVIRHKELLVLTLSELGFGKVTPIEQFPRQNRGGQGVYAAKVNTKTGILITGRIIDHPEKEYLIMSKEGQAVKIPTASLPERNRQTVGVRMIKLRSGDKVAASTII
jgi:DNA gyrase subunit A